MRSEMESPKVRVRGASSAGTLADTKDYGTAGVRPRSVRCFMLLLIRAVFFHVRAVFSSIRAFVQVLLYVL
jgi:hypothetical protein